MKTKIDLSLLSIIMLIILCILSAPSMGQRGYYHSGYIHQPRGHDPRRRLYSEHRTVPRVHNGAEMHTYDPYPLGTFYDDYYDKLMPGRYSNIVAARDPNNAYTVHDPSYVPNEDLHRSMRRQLGYDPRGIQNNNIGLSAVRGGTHSVFEHDE